jgi:hypothetical protein
VGGEQGLDALAQERVIAAGTVEVRGAVGSAEFRQRLSENYFKAGWIDGHVRRP